MTEKRYKLHHDYHFGYGVEDTYNSDRLYLDDFELLVDELNALNDENEQLKSTIKEVTELLSGEVDVFSDKALEHDICAYMELKELDNKDAYYMATATKKAIKMLKELQE